MIHEANAKHARKMEDIKAQAKQSETDMKNSFMEVRRGEGEGK